MLSTNSVEEGYPLVKKKTDDDGKSFERDPCLAVLPRRYVLAVMCLFAIALAYLYRVNTTIAVISIVKEHHYSLSDKGWILSGFFFGYIFTQLPGGYLATRFGATRVLAVGLGLASVVTALTPMCASRLPLLIFARFATGLAEGVTYPCVQTLLPRWIPGSERSVILGLVFAGSPVGTASTDLIAPWIIDRFGWEWVFYSFAAVGGVWLILWLGLAGDSPSHPSWLIGIGESEREHLARNISPMDSKSESIPWFALLKLRPVWACMFAAFAGGWGLYVLLSWAPSYLNLELGYSLTTSGHFLIAGYGLLAVNSLIGGILADRLINSFHFDITNVRKLMWGMGCLIPATLLCILAFIPKMPKLLAAFCSMAAIAAYGFANSGMPAACLEMSPTYGGVIFAFANLVGTIPGIVGVYSTSSLLAAFPGVFGWQVVFGMASAIYVLGAATFIGHGTAQRLMH